MRTLLTSGAVVQKCDKKKVKALEAELAEVKKQAEETNEKYLRMLAEYDNFRKRSEKDKRQVFVSINMENAEVYERQHKNVLNFVDQVLEKVRNDKAEEIIQLFTLISNKAKEVID